MVSEQVPVKLSCKTLSVSRSGYYSWLKRPESLRVEENKKLIAEIVKIHYQSRGTYGSPRIARKLKQSGQNVGENRVVRLMKESGISGLVKKKFKVVTTDSNHDSPIAERIFKTEDVVTHPTRMNQVWASDISYIPTGEGFLFLGTYLDLFTRKVVGFAMEDHMQSCLLVKALEMGLGRQNLVTNNLISHSDRGSQYASTEYRNTLQDLGITASMSRRGNCYDNAFAESFFATLKKELIYRSKYNTKAEAKAAIFEYIEVWYNRNRMHSAIGYMTPVQFEESLAA